MISEGPFILKGKSSFDLSFSKKQKKHKPICRETKEKIVRTNSIGFSYNLNEKVICSL